MKNITVTEAYQWLKSNDVTLIDVREEHEFEQCRIEGAQLVPLSCLVESIQKISIPQGNKVIFQCLKGGRSAQAIDFLKENYLKDHDLYNMEGGILAWTEAGYPVIQA